MKVFNTVLNKVLYAVIFLILIPIILVYWAKATSIHFNDLNVRSHETGAVIFLLGCILLIWGMLALIVKGEGLPMNAFPPKKLVKEGAYRLLHHPIYWGFGLMVLGYFVYIGSFSGIWLITPITVLAMVALVLGYENQDLHKRFSGYRLNTILDLPMANGDRAVAIKKIAVLFWVILALLIRNVVLALNSGRDPLSDEFWSLPNIEASGAILNYLGIIFILVTPFILKENKNLRQWCVYSLLAISLELFSVLFGLMSLQNIIPVETNFMVFVPIYLILISLSVIFSHGPLRVLKISVAAIPFLIVQYVLFSGIVYHWLVSIAVFILSVKYRGIWLFLRRESEKMANSWKEWTLGKIRVINHGFYVGVGAFLGIFMAGILAGPDYAWVILIFAITVVIFSALWAQVIEGSEKLKRPYGYYGALVGILFASILVWALGYNPWVLIGVISVAMPWVQAIGRLRCLINGCCHGKTTSEKEIGIRYYHPRSRVCNISEMKGEYLHPTPLYSILWLLLVGFVLVSLWYGNYASNFIFGMYLILTGLGRFVEEAYRGEVQTPVIRGLRLYQWTAMLSVILGIIFTAFKVDLPAITPGLSWEVLTASIIGGIFLTFAMGVDFPYSNKRFSRLV
ncbi:prolipoprotein diacylglyceryl transferase family protein [uncultured Eudoraea sp.]|uniref:prolipoprotein diacylglyceryl transferase family protein n=1 Tax=uncultured Eudoraea sp. TaxID=1035614 RepID=UPI00262D6FC3|nr:prolipoprotein diacylglyceryl transferase family protein [uncultured Eudoraea sp.]